MRAVPFAICAALTLIIGAAIYPATPQNAETRTAETISTPIAITPSGSAVSSPLSAVKPPPDSRKAANYPLRSILIDTPPPAVADRIGKGREMLARQSEASMPPPSLTFDGISNFDNGAVYGNVFLPPDVTGDVGPQHYVQAVNSLLRIYDKNGNALSPLIRFSDLFAPLGTPCSMRNDGLPVVLYDQIADRWLISTYCNYFPPFRQMIAVSKTSDPLGGYYLYEYVMPNIRIGDFPKLAVWQNSYLMATEEFLGSDYYGEGIYAFDRAKMLRGDSGPSAVYISRRSNSLTRRRGMLPIELDGIKLPRASQQPLFASFTADEYGDAADAVRLYELRPDFASPVDSTFTELSGSPFLVDPFDPTSNDDRRDIAQPAPGEFLDANSDRLNFRAAYRIVGSTELIVMNQTVRTLPGATYRAGVRVYTLRRSGTGNFAIEENSTIGDTLSSRWIGSAATDNQGNIAVSYNFVNDIKKPSILYTGRLASEPVGTFRQEETIMAGSGVQKAFGWRWGDYTGMTVDPTDDCTFWTTGQYYTQASETASDFGWLTRIGKFKFNECTAPPKGTINGTVRNTGGVPLAGITVGLGRYSRVSRSDGGYGPLPASPGGYQLTVSEPGYLPESYTVAIADGVETLRDIFLTPVPVITSQGVNVDAESCGINGSPEPGENVTVNFTLNNTGQLNASNVSAELLPTGGVTQPGPPQNYGALAAGGASVTRSFTFRVDPAMSCGAVLTLTLQITDKGTNIGTVVKTFRAGAERIAFFENFDRRMQAQVPPRWSRSTVRLNPDEPPFARDWKVSTAHAFSGSKAAYAYDSLYYGLSEMTSPVFEITSANARLTFKNWYELETTFLRNRLFDGSVLEIKIGSSGEWQDIIAAGGVFESGGYDGTIDSCCQNPLGGRQGWSGRSGIDVDMIPQFIDTAIRLPAAAAGQKIQLRWRLGTDIGTWREGQYIDDVRVTDGYSCGCTIP